MGSPSDPLPGVGAPRAAVDPPHLLGDELGAALRPPDRERHGERLEVARPHFTGGSEVAEFGQVVVGAEAQRRTLDPGRARPQKVGLTRAVRAPCLKTPPSVQHLPD